MTETNILSITKPMSLTTTKEINALWHATLVIENNDYIVPESYVEFEGELYIAKKIKKIIDKSQITFRISLDHLMTELNDYGVAPFDITGTATNLLTIILFGTGWSVGTVNVSGNERVHSEKRITPLAALNLAAEAWDGELYFHAIRQKDGSFSRKVDLVDQIGIVTKHQIRYDKNADYIKDEEDTTKLVTRLYLYGRNDITIESVNPTGKPYLDSANIADYKNIKEYTLYTNISDKTVLMNYGQAYLDLYDSPIHRYRINIADMTVLPTWAYEETNLGDTLRVYNKEINLKVDCRVKKIIRDLVNPKNLIIELANKFKTIVEPINDIQQVIQNITFHNDYRALDLRDIAYKNNSIPYSALIGLIPANKLNIAVGGWWGHCWGGADLDLNGPNPGAFTRVNATIDYPTYEYTQLDAGEYCDLVPMITMPYGRLAGGRVCAIVACEWVATGSVTLQLQCASGVLPGIGEANKYAPATAVYNFDFTAKSKTAGQMDQIDLNRLDTDHFWGTNWWYWFRIKNVSGVSVKIYGIVFTCEMASVIT